MNETKKDGGDIETIDGERGSGRIILPFCHIAHETQSKTKGGHSEFQLPMPCIGFQPLLTSISQPFSCGGRDDEDSF